MGNRKRIQAELDSTATEMTRTKKLGAFAGKLQGEAWRKQNEATLRKAQVDLANARREAAQEAQNELREQLAAELKDIYWREFEEESKVSQERMKNDLHSELQSQHVADAEKKVNEVKRQQSMANMMRSMKEGKSKEDIKKQKEILEKEKEQLENRLRE